jgi:NAD(P)-dependent dehydrogenase (short-subunit alcohol dehydrogenase family)
LNNTSTQEKKVLVTGASGLLGVAATEKFLAAGWEVIGLSRQNPALPILDLDVSSSVAVKFN